MNTTYYTHRRTKRHNCKLYATHKSLDAKPKNHLSFSTPDQHPKHINCAAYLHFSRLLFAKSTRGTKIIHLNQYSNSLFTKITRKWLIPNIATKYLNLRTKNEILHLKKSCYKKWLNNICVLRIDLQLLQNLTTSHIWFYNKIDRFLLHFKNTYTTKKNPRKIQLVGNFQKTLQHLASEYTIKISRLLLHSKNTYTTSKNPRKIQLVANAQKTLQHLSC
jgi:hypothetical protein